jgi:hypothetical protein
MAKSLYHLQQYHEVYLFDYMVLRQLLKNKIQQELFHLNFILLLLYYMV